ncbi:MAG TPA: Crp/Fnr family transcriptional regulator [Azospirillaceae bacterium]|nr:Crp/Fnr family transcriptional regulator [Azospirillaceae bacterium]
MPFDLAALVPADRLATRRLAPGETLFRQGDAVAALHRVEAGRVRLLRHLEDGAAVALHLAQAGETVAEASLFAERYHCDAVAETPTKVTSVPKAALLAALRRDPAAALGLAGMLASQVRDLRARLELRNVRSARERLLAWMRLGASGSPPVLALDRTWSAVAEELGMSREALYRALAALERAGAISRRGSEVTLPARAAGASLAGAGGASL